VLGGGSICSLTRLVVIGRLLSLTRLRHRPPPVLFLQPPCPSVALQRHAEVIRPNLHAQLATEIFADLLGRDAAAQHLDRA
jgi:hypothetical protein